MTIILRVLYIHLYGICFIYTNVRIIHTTPFINKIVIILVHKNNYGNCAHKNIKLLFSRMLCSDQSTLTTLTLANHLRIPAPTTNENRSSFPPLCGGKLWRKIWRELGCCGVRIGGCGALLHAPLLLPPPSSSLLLPPPYSRHSL